MWKQSQASSVSDKDQKCQEVERSRLRGKSPPGFQSRKTEILSCLQPGISTHFLTWPCCFCETQQSNMLHIIPLISRDLLMMSWRKLMWVLWLNSTKGHGFFGLEPNQSVLGRNGRQHWNIPLRLDSRDLDKTSITDELGWGAVQASHKTLIQQQKRFAC